MSELSRREFARLMGRVGIALPLGGTLLAACGDDKKAASGAGAAKNAVTMPRVGLSSPVQPSYVNILAGPIEYGEEFGLKASERDFTVFESHELATQAVLGGKLDIVGASTISHLALIARGGKFRIFAPLQDLTDLTIVGRGSVASLDDLMDPKNKVAIDDPGGAAMAAFDAILIDRNAGFMSNDIPNKVILGSSGLRGSALAAGQADATILQEYEAPPIDAKTHDVNIIAKVYDSAPQFMMQSFAASQEWLDSNPESAAAFVASLIKANRALVENFKTYDTAVQRYIKEPPKPSDLEKVFGVIKQYEFWPKDGGLDAGKLEFMINLGGKEEIFDAGKVAVDAALDTRPRDQGLSMVGA
jgi:ABC-type nitrate/sulfonate/bicarbonate transport system substrate-binding protein